MRTCNFRIFRQMATGYNRTLVFAARLSQSDDYFFSGYLDRYLCTSVHFRMLNSGWVFSDLVLILPFTLSS